MLKPMKRRVLAAGAVILTVLACILLAAAANAEVIDLEGTVKGVDKDARTISVVRKTAKGEKVLDLEVAKKAGDLSEVDEGDSVSFSYDPDLELITKIVETDGGEKKAASAPAKQVCRVVLEFMADGSSRGHIAQRQGGESVSAEAFVKKRNDDGTWELTHHFPSDAAVGGFNALAPLVGAHYDQPRKAMHLKVVKDGRGTPKESLVVYPLRIRVPLKVELDVVAEAGSCHLGIGLNIAPPNLHPVWEVFTKDGFQSVGSAVSWVVARDPNTGKAEVKSLFLKEKELLSQGIDFQAPSPIPVRVEDVWMLQVAAFPGDKGANKGAYISRIAVTARVAPVLGIKFKDGPGKVTVEKVVERSPAQKAGIKAGDIILQIDGKAATDVQRALQILSMTGFGESCKVEVGRGDVKETITMSGEWPTFE